MWNILVQLITSKGFRFFLRLIASVASAVVVISGFLFWQNQGKEKTDERGDSSTKGEASEKQQSAKIHFLHRK